MLQSKIIDINWTYDEMVKRLPPESRYELRNNELIEIQN